MNLYDRIGTMVITPTDRYIIGASDSENEDFRRKSQNIIEFNQRDTVELSCIKQINLKSENYENYMKTKKCQRVVLEIRLGISCKNQSQIQSIHIALEK